MQSQVYDMLLLTVSCFLTTEKKPQKGKLVSWQRDRSQLAIFTYTR